MNTNCDENSWYLSEFLHNEDQEHQKWLDTLPEKVSAITEYAYILMIGNTDSSEYDWAFASYTNSDEGYEHLATVLDDWQAQVVAQGDEEFLFDVAVCALEASSQILFDTELKEIVNEGGFSVAKMVGEVLGDN
jgi:hypothetical protein